VLVLAVFGALFLVAHLAELPKTLEDLDSINFALGVRDFDVARHQPHPPGYPVFIALAKASTAVFRAAGVASPEPRGLAIWGALGGAFAALPLFTFFRRLEGDRRRALAATIVTMAAPLYWFTANRPLSDMTGLAAVLAAQALAVAAWARLRDPSADPVGARRRLLAAAAMAGLAIGIRSQTFVLTLPLLGLVLADRRVPASRRALASALAAFLAGVLVWGIPLIVASGSVGAYLAVLGNQGGEDFSGVAMLWTQLTRHSAGMAKPIAYASRDTFALPWATIPLAKAVLTLAAVGAGVLAWRSRAALLVIIVAAVPYALFHLLFQETATVRYALPLVPVTAYLAVVAIDALSTALSRRVSSSAGLSGLAGALVPGAVAAIVAASLWTAGPALYRYAAAGSPVFQALADIDARARATGARPALAAHWDSKRAEEWIGSDLPGSVLRVERAHEWLAAAQYWLAGGREPVWFLARPGRTDLALVDPAHRVLAGEYRWAFDTRVFTGGARPNGVDWYDLSSPGWFLDRGWAITPEIAGVAHAEGAGPHVRPSLGYLARRPDEALLMIGGRHLSLGAATDPPVRIKVQVDNRTVLEWDQPPGFFLRFQPLAAGALAGDGAFARLAVSSSNSGSPIPVGLEQFDLQSAGAVVWGYDEGWMEPEHDPAKALSWRWTLARSTLNIHGAGRDVTIRMSGESPLKNFDAPPQVTIKAGERTIATFSPDRDFVEEFTVPADVLAAAHGLLVMETDRTFAPPNGDPRRLGLRVYQVTVK
jgi:hypothetical protein